MVYWGVGLAAMALLVVLMVPLFDMQSMATLLESFPPVILAMVGIGDDLAIFTTNEGFVVSRILRQVGPDIRGLPGRHGYAESAPTKKTTAPAMCCLSLPISRAQVMVEKFLAYAVSIVGVVVLIYLGLYVGVVCWEGSN